MGCLNVNIEVIETASPEISLYNYGETCNVSLGVLGERSMDMEVYLYDEILDIYIEVLYTEKPSIVLMGVDPTLNITLGIIGEPLVCDVSEICTVDTNYYLRVSPEIVWFTPDVLYDNLFNVQSNTNWKINY